jgi:thiamine biosynthesis protein ThiS
MEVNINTTVEQLIDILGFRQYQLAVVINNKVVTRTKWKEIFLQENDNVIVIKAVSGG